LRRRKAASLREGAWLKFCGVLAKDKYSTKIYAKTRAYFQRSKSPSLEESLSLSINSTTIHSNKFLPEDLGKVMC